MNLPENWYYPLENVSDNVFDRVKKYLKNKNASHLSDFNKNTCLLSKHPIDNSYYWGSNMEHLIKCNYNYNYTLLTEKQFLEKIPVDELIKDEYYYCSLYGNNESFIIFQFEKREDRPFWIEGKTLKNGVDVDKNIDNTLYTDYIRFATQEEIQLFKQKTNTMEKEIIKAIEYLITNNLIK